MPFETTCPKGHRLQVSDSHLGQRIQCPACNESFIVPGSIAASGTLTRSPQSKSDLSRLTRWAGRPLIAVGLLLALLSKGCDAINLRSAARAAAVAKTTVEQFDEDVKAKKLAMQNETRLRDDAKPDDRKRAEEARKELIEFGIKSDKDRSGRMAGEWHELQTAAENAKRTFAVNGYWHELFFVFAAVVLVVGLLIESWCAEGPERQGRRALCVVLARW
jgi:hypothetical protein